ncbi:MAG: Uma2 family endonuclease [Candidatus Eremiobacterota bacterium]
MKTVYTGEDLLKLQLRGRFELVRGSLVELTPPGWLHGYVQTRVAGALLTWAEEGALGYVVTESGVYTEREPDTVRGPDVSYTARERLTDVPEGYPSAPPDQVVEVASPDDCAAELEAKVQEYLRAGVRRVWVLFPRTRTVYSHAPDGTVRKFEAGHTLSEPDVLPGFECPVARLFP